MRYKDILTEDELFEINMSPTNLQKLAAAIPGAKAGLEFEMIVPDVEPDRSGDSEPDYDYDERCRSIQDAYDFFFDNDWNSRRSCEEMRSQMENDYFEWRDEKISDKWNDDGLEYLEKWIRENVTEDEWKVAGEDDDEAFDEFVRDEWNRHGDYYDSAREGFTSDYEDDWDQSDWLDDAGLDYMSNIENAYQMNWPHWIEPEEDLDISEIANAFDQELKRGVEYASGYHDIDRRDQSGYIIEPDGSLSGRMGDAGLEFVSPPLTIPEMISDLKKVVKWANDTGCYTGKQYKTGLHMNISVPRYSRDNLDYVKLAVLLGDEHVLKEFGRMGNSYCRSAMELLKTNVAGRPDMAKEALDKMKDHLAKAAGKVIHSGNTDKFTSINVKDNRVEFRGPGGDWIGMYNKDPGKLINPMLRMVVALDAACDPNKYRQEYQKKLYKLLNPEGQKDQYGDMIAEFAKYASAVGGASQQAVIDFRRAVTQHLTKSRKANKPEPAPDTPAQASDNVYGATGQASTTDLPLWYVSIIGQPGTEVQVHARNEQLAWAVARGLRFDIFGNESIGNIRVARTGVRSTLPGSTTDLQQRRAAGEFTGQWKVVDNDGNELYRFGGVGNSQRDANGVALRFLTANRPDINVNQVHVLPIMGNN